MKNLVLTLVVAMLFVVGCVDKINNGSPSGKNNPACPSHICAPNGAGTVIYGEDNRLDYYKLKKLGVNAGVIKNCDAVASSWDKYKIRTYSGLNQASLITASFGERYDLAKTEPFYDQPIGAHCTSFLVAPDIVVTAGHCLNGLNLVNKRFIFKTFRLEKAGGRPVFAEVKNIYKAEKLLAHKLSRNGMDYAVIKLDRVVEGVTPLKLATEDVKAGEWVYVLGHPCGLPLKYAPCGKVMSTRSSIYFTASLDTYGGNSGSPVFNSKNEVVGILVRGETDFIYTANGRVSRQGVNGESCTKVSNWAKYCK